MKAGDRTGRRVCNLLLLSAAALAGCGTADAGSEVQEGQGETAIEVADLPDGAAEVGDLLLETNGGDSETTDGPSPEIPGPADEVENDTVEPDEGAGADEVGEVTLSHSCGGSAKSSDISGTVYYPGTLPEKWTLQIHYFEGTEKPSGPLAPPQGALVCKNPGFPNDYGIDLKNQPGTYWIAALLDLDADMEIEVAQLYPDPIVLVAGEPVSGIDFHLE